MAELNIYKNQLYVPESDTIWGYILGDINDQKDLVSLIDNAKDTVKEWVLGKGYLTEHQSLADYALKTDIPSLDGYATESWVEGKGYLTEHQDLKSYALTATVETYVNDLQTQINAINTTIGEMETITNEILA